MSFWVAKTVGLKQVGRVDETGGTKIKKKSFNSEENIRKTSVHVHSSSFSETALCWNFDSVQKGTNEKNTKNICFEATETLSDDYQIFF